MHCSICGKENKENAIFCASCGTKIAIDNRPQKKEETEIIEEIIVPEEKIESMAPNIVIMGIVLVTMIVSIGLIIFL